MEVKKKKLKTKLQFLIYHLPDTVTNPQWKLAYLDIPWMV